MLALEPGPRDSRGPVSLVIRFDQLLPLVDLVRLGVAAPALSGTRNLAVKDCATNILWGIRAALEKAGATEEVKLMDSGLLTADALVTDLDRPAFLVLEGDLNTRAYRVLGGRPPYHVLEMRMKDGRPGSEPITLRELSKLSQAQLLCFEQIGRGTVDVIRRAMRLKGFPHAL